MTQQPLHFTRKTPFAHHIILAFNLRPIHRKQDAKDYELMRSRIAARHQEIRL